LATLHELDTVLGAADLYDLLEILAVDSHNQRVANERRD
jgi:4-diphosphocytidyl-2C-methyl-D-erythritol kinase